MNVFVCNMGRQFCMLKYKQFSNNQEDAYMRNKVNNMNKVIQCKRGAY